MKVLLIDPPGWQKHSINLGLAYLAGTAMEANMDVQILDMNNRSYPEDRLKKIVAKFDPQVIGVSVKTATANSSADIIRKLKSVFQDIIYVAGGPHITLCGNEFMNENKEIDFGITGEGESSFVNLLKSAKDGKQSNYGISGIYYRKNGGLIFNSSNGRPDVSKLAFPRFEYVKDMDFTDFRYPLLTSRGCPYGCIFCCVGIISGKEWRGRSPEDVIDELIQAKERYQISSFEIMDDNFTFDIERAKKICELIVKKKLNLEWWCHNGLRADKLDQELLNLMKKAGCKSIALGIETGDKEVFKNINKGEELSDIISAVRMIKKAGIKCVGYFIIGLPGETIETIKNTVRLQNNLGLADYKYNMLIPYPGTRIWQVLHERGGMLADIKDMYHFGDNIKIPFEIGRLNKDTIEKCLYLANNHDWIYIESCMHKIKEFFNSRFHRDIKRIFVISDDAMAKTERYIEIEFSNSDIIEAKIENTFRDVRDQHVLPKSAGIDYFYNLIKLKKLGYDFIIDVSKKKIFLKKTRGAIEEYVRGEALADIMEWDKTSKRYLAVRLKHHSKDINSPKNGIIYKDGIPLSYSPCPQWEKVPCGKIESGIVFISLAAFNPKSKYAADYLSIKDVSEIKELITHDNTSLVESLISVSDILFCPEPIKHLTMIISRAKMNVLYTDKCYGNRFQICKNLEVFSGGRGEKGYAAKKACAVYSNIKNMAGRTAMRLFSDVKKCVKVLMLWAHIICFMIIKNINVFVAKIIRF